MPSLFRLFFLVLLTLALGGCAKKVDPAGAAKQFFERVAGGQIKEAYDATAFAFQAQETEKVFAQTVKELGLLEYESGQWKPAEIKGREAHVEVEAAMKNGKKRPFVVTLLQESGAWRIYAIRSPRSEVTGLAENHFSLVGKGASFNDALSRAIPDEKDVKRLALETVLRFNQAIQDKSFTDFYDKVSLAWQRQLTEGQLERAFKPFIEKEVNLADVATVEPVFDPPPSINNDGLLLISGHYPTTPYKVYFNLKFVYELPKWRLFGIDVNLQK